MSITAYFSNPTVDPEITGVLSAAFDTAWQRVVDSGSPLAAVDAAAAMREILAKNIIAAAQDGERDKNGLVEGALAHLTLSAQTRAAAPSR
ncbi:MAG: hypothetical protein WBB34_13075 [Xanthobacteraceae bacterium]